MFSMLSNNSTLESYVRGLYSCMLVILAAFEQVTSNWKLQVEQSLRNLITYLASREGHTFQRGIDCQF